VPAGFDAFLTFAELLIFKPILQLLNFPPHYYKWLLVVVIFLFYFILFNCFFCSVGTGPGDAMAM